MRISFLPLFVRFLLLVAFSLCLLSPAEAQKKKKAPVLPEGATVQKDILYATHDGVDLHLDLYLPKADSPKPLPVVFWVHGGGWLNGSKERCKATFLLEDGFAVASVGYRLTDVAQWPGQIDDCYAAVRFLRSNAGKYGLDPERFGAMGSSGRAPRRADGNAFGGGGESQQPLASGLRLVRTNGFAHDAAQRGQ